MADEDKHSKTEEPTSKRLEDARKKDAPPQSRDLTSMVTLIAAIITLYFTGRFMFSTLLESSRELLAGMGTFQVTEAGTYNLMLKLMGTMALVLGPYLLTVMAAGIAVNFAQGGIELSWEKLTCKFDKLNPLTGVKRLFNKDSLMEMVKSMLKIGLVGYVSYRVIRGQEDALSYLSDRDISDIFAYVGLLAFKIIVYSCEVLLVLAFLDLAFVKWSYLQKMRMTKEEVKQEHKDSDGDQQTKGKIRRLQFDQSRRRLMKIIPTADVIITNPTHFAVALKYDREKMAAPIVIAKGADHLAQRIKEIARENRVMLVENRFLARELYAGVKEGHEVPEKLYAAVAEVLAYVFGLKGKI
jgi:flagellar biosynthetic protein FlhB